jgi:DNA-binding NtrC family response regulator
MIWRENMHLLSTLRKMKILLIDDDEWIRGSLQLFFEAEGCQLIALETAEEGLAALREDTYDIIIVDYNLPGQDGIEFLKQIRNAHSDAIKILITAYKSEPIVSEAKKLGIQGFIEKPFTSETILGSLSYLIKKREKREEIHAK